MHSVERSLVWCSSGRKNHMTSTLMESDRLKPCSEDTRTAVSTPSGRDGSETMPAENRRSHAGDDLSVVEVPAENPAVPDQAVAEPRYPGRQRNEPNWLHPVVRHSGTVFRFKGGAV